MYNLTRVFADGVERKRALYELLVEIERNDRETIVEINSRKDGIVWSGHAKNALADLTHSFVKHCVQEIDEDQYGVSLIIR